MNKKALLFSAMAIAVILLALNINRTKPSTDTHFEKDTKTLLTSDKTTITICALKDHSLEIALELLKESDFEEENNINVESVLLEFEPMERAHKFDLSLDKGEYDIVTIDQPSLGYYVTNNWVLPLNTFIEDTTLPSLELDDIAPVLRKHCGEWKNNQYAIPIGSYGSLFAYRSDVIKDAPRTFIEFKELAEKVNSPPNIYGTALFAHIGEYITADAAPFLWSWGAGLINACDVNLENRAPYRVAWDTQEGLEALEFYASIYREGLTPRESLWYDHERYIGAFQSGKVAMGIMPAEGIGPPMEDIEASIVVGKVKYSSLPVRKKSDGTLGAPRPGLGAHSLAISKHSKNPKAAYRVIQHLTGIEISEEYIKRGGRPFRLSHFSDTAINQYPYLKEIEKGMKTGKCRPNIPEYKEVSKIFYTAFHSAIKHNASISEVMRAAAVKANKEILAPKYP